MDQERKTKGSLVSSSSVSADCKCPVFIRVDEGGVKCVLDWDESAAGGKCV